MHEFTVDGTAFRQTSLKLKPSLRGAAIVAEVVLPGIVGIAALRDALDPGLLTKALTGISRIEELVDLFSAVCKVERDGRWLELGAFLELTFERRNAALLAWLLECVTWQYADFLSDAGQNLIAQAGSALFCQLGWTGASGE